MDKQNNVSQIPVNTRTIGTPGGIYILYLEDYVHTFIKKFTAAYYVNAPNPVEIALFGRRYEENGSSVLVVSGAAQQPFPEEKGTQYFPSCALLGSAKVGLNKESGLRLEIALKNTSVILDDFYIYYDQNEEMQNYLIEWNLHSRVSGYQGEGEYVQEAMPGSYGTSGTEAKPPRRGAQVRAETDEAVRYGRIAQAYNRGEAKVSFIWNVMSALCLGFVVCVMAYGIISVNNYNKMKSMQDTIDYCLALVTESLKQNEAILTNATAVATVLNGQAEGMDTKSMDTKSTDANSTDMEPEDKVDRGTAKEEELSGGNAANTESAADTATDGAVSADVNINNDMLAAGQTPNPIEDTTTDVLMQNGGGLDSNVQGGAAVSVQEEGAALEQSVEAREGAALGQSAETVENEANTEKSVTADGQGVTETPSTPQYYVVRRGDTLRSICFQVYGNYSKVDEICEWNKIEDPNNILYGQRLLLP